ncbi:hypothetical protein HPT25_27170 [Bacillus sp. BRMEA1]|uniref:hypothetical protein n=1 Tax=Neobacillus endophyticus TaxID=2738405 RepID=UPI0015657953|nr:hypothetical protein [Neobacillus endophyticus]NRD81005.1 hypothetical protein [Neobacillus endophyticus]
MKTKVEISIGLLILLILLAIILGLITSLSGLLVTSVEAAKQDYISAIIGSLGNVIGGIIGVLAAVLVAAYQIRKTFDLERNKGVANNSAVLRLIRTELESNHRLIQNFREQYVQGNKTFLDLISTDNWERCSLQIGMETSDDTLNAVSSVYRKINLLKSDRNMDVQTYDRLVSDLSAALGNVDNDLRLLQSNN